MTTHTFEEVVLFDGEAEFMAHRSGNKWLRAYAYKRDVEYGTREEAEQCIAQALCDELVNADAGVVYIDDKPMNIRVNVTILED